MKTSKQKLRDVLQVHQGWDIGRVDDGDLEWWADEIWQLTSRWKPAGATAFVTFLVDPQHEGLRKRGEAVWAVAVGAELPRSRREAEEGGTFPIGSFGGKDQDALLARLEQLRPR